MNKTVRFNKLNGTKGEVALAKEVRLRLHDEIMSQPHVYNFKMTEVAVKFLKSITDAKVFVKYYGLPYADFAMNVLEDKMEEYNLI